MDEIEKNSIRVLIIIGSLEIGGAEKHVATLARQLRKYSITVGVCALSAAGTLKDGLQEDGVQVFHPNHQGKFCSLINKIKILRALFSYFKSAWTFLRAYYIFRPQVAHFFLPGAYIIGGLTSLITPCRARVMSRRSLNFYQQGKPLLTKLEYFLHTKMDRVTGNSKSVIDDLIAEGVSDRKLKLIYNGVAIPERPQTRVKRLTNRIEIVCVANLIPYKGHLDLFEALASVPRVFSWHLTCIGRDDNYLKELESATSDFGISNVVDFVGPVLDPLSYLAKADIGVNCSHQEGFSNALLEYMASGLGIVATDVGGNAEAIRHQVDGIIVSSRKPAEIKHAIMMLFEKNFREQLGTSARQRAIDTFANTKCIVSYAKMYRELIEV